MSAVALTDRYAANLHGVLSCYDRVIITFTLPGVCYADQSPHRAEARRVGNRAKVRADKLQPVLPQP